MAGLTPGRAVPLILVIIVVATGLTTFGCSSSRSSSIPVLDTNGATYIEEGRGLRVAQAGTNLCVNPSAGIDTTGAAGENNALVERQEAGGYLGGSCWRLTTTGLPGGNADGMRIAESLGAWSLPPLDDDHDQYQVSFYARLISTGGPTDQFNIVAEWEGGSAISDDFTLTDSWQLYSFGFETAGGALDIRLMPNFGGGTGTAADTVMLVDGITLEAEKSFSEDIFGTDEEDKIYPVPPYNGSSPGSRWSGAPHASTSIRTAGTNKFHGPDFGLAFDDESWWFGIDCTIGFEDEADLFETNSKEFFVIGEPDGTGYGWTDDAAFVFDYHSKDRKFYFHRYPAIRGEAQLESPKFDYGDRLRAVGAWDADARKTYLWLVIGDDSSDVIYSEGSNLEEMASLGSEYQVNLGFSGGWYAGQWQTNSLHRNFVLEEGLPTEEQVTAYLNQPQGPLMSGGFFYPLVEDLAGSRIDNLGE